MQFSLKIDKRDGSRVRVDGVNEDSTRRVHDVANRKQSAVDRNSRTRTSNYADYPQPTHRCLVLFSR